MASQGAAGKGARRARGYLHAQRGWLARAGSGTGNGEGNSFSTGRDAGVGSLLRQVIPVEVKNRYVIQGPSDI